jgi:hypothetical protein
MAESNEATKGGTPSRQGEYAKVAAHEDKILQTLLDLLDHKNENVRLGAAKALFNKILPDRKAVELTGQNGEPIKLNIIAGRDYLSSIAVSTAASEGSTTYGSTSIQSSSVAQESEKDDDSNKPAS